MLVWLRNGSLGQGYGERIMGLTRYAELSLP
jgi:hypothetical protein